MVSITYLCPECQKATRAAVIKDQPVACMHCGHKQLPDHDAWNEQSVARCLICSSTELYVRKDFSQALGLTIIIGGFAAASVTWFLHYSVITFAILVATALIDALLYKVTGNALHCYRCHSELRGLEGLEQHNPFDLEIFERHRQQAARLEQAEREEQRRQPTAER